MSLATTKREKRRNSPCLFYSFKTLTGLKSLPPLTGKIEERLWLKYLTSLLTANVSRGAEILKKKKLEFELDF